MPGGRIDIAKKEEIKIYEPRLLPTIDAFHLSTAPIRCIVGPVGSGKTTAATWEMMMYITIHMKKKFGITRTSWVVIRNTYTELVDTTQKTVFEWFGWGKYSKQEKRYQLRLPQPNSDCNIEVLFRSCDRPQDVKKFKSLEVTGFWIDESTEIDVGIKKMLMNRIGRFPPKCPVKWGIETTNPPDVEHPTYHQYKWIEPPPGPMPTGEPLANHVGFWQPPYENVQNLGPRYYDDLRLAYADDPDWVAMYIEGKPGIIIHGRQVYSNFTRRMHVANGPLVWEGQHLYRGWDNSGNTPACVVVSVPTPLQAHVLREFHTDRQGIVDFADRVVNECNVAFPGADYEDWGDPAGENRYSRKDGGLTSNAELMRNECDILVYPSEQNPIVRQSSVSKMLGRIAGLIIDPSCTRLINGFMGGYCFPPSPGIVGEFGRTPLKNKYSHCLVGSMKVSTPFGKKRIDRIKVGDIVSTPKGAKPVTATMNSVANKIYTVKVGGKTLECTGDHPIYTNKDCIISVEALQYGDTIVMEGLWEDWRSMRLKSPRGSGTILDRMDITRPIGKNTKESIFMSLFGSTIIARFRNVIVCITKTTISLITELRTSASCLSLNTQLITVENGSISIQRQSKDTWKGFDLWLQSGMGQKKDGNQAEKQQKRRGTRLKKNKESVLHVEKSILVLKTLVNVISVLWLVSRRLAGNLAWITKRGFAHFVGKNTRLQNIQNNSRVQEVVYRNTEARVYDLTVEGAHCFYANGILVGNCHDALQYIFVKLFESQRRETPENEVIRRREKEYNPIWD